MDQAQRAPMTEEEIRAAVVGELKPLEGPILLAEYDPAWPALFEREAARIRLALGDATRLVEHAGSTSVPGLPDTNVNLHVFTVGAREIERMLLFRDWLRANPADRDPYQRTKRELVARSWQYVRNYADAKTAVVDAILDRARVGTARGVRPRGDDA